MASLRVRLLMASIGLVLVALIVSGVLSVFLVENLEMRNTQDQLTNTVGNTGTQVVNADTAAAAAQTGCGGATTSSVGPPRAHLTEIYLCSLSDHLQSVPLSSDQNQGLLVLSSDLTVLYSSQDDLYQTQALPHGTLGFPHTNAKAGDPSLSGTGYISGQPFLYAATPVEGVHAAWVVLTVPRTSVNAQAARSVIPPVLDSAGAALILAIAVSLLLSRALTRPLIELEQASRDIAAGNYGRRAKVEGPREVSAVTESFNRMAAFVVHDLKNLVAQLSLMLRNAERHRDNPEFQDDMLETVAHVEAKMRELMTQLQEKRSIDPPRVLNLVKKLENVRRAKHEQFPRLELSMPLDCDTLPVLAHPGRLERVIGHIVQNAIEATPEDGKVRVTLETSDPERVQVVVTDTGCGMSESFIHEQLSRPFQTTKTSGMGIGVYETRQYIRELGGDVSYESKEGVGTRVTIDLPLHTRLDPEHMEKEHEEKSGDKHD